MERLLMVLVACGALFLAGAGCGGDDPNGGAPPEDVDGGVSGTSDDAGEDGPTSGTDAATERMSTAELEPPDCTDRTCSWPDEREHVDDDGCRTCMAVGARGEACERDTDCHHQHFCNEGACERVVGQPCDGGADCPESGFCARSVCVTMCEPPDFRCAGGVGCAWVQSYAGLDANPLCLPDEVCEQESRTCFYADE